MNTPHTTPPSRRARHRHTNGHHANILRTITTEALRPIRHNPLSALIPALTIAIASAAFILSTGMQGINDAAAAHRLDSMLTNHVTVSINTEELPPALAQPTNITQASARIGLREPLITWQIHDAKTTRNMPNGTQTTHTWPITAATEHIAQRSDIHARHALAPMLSTDGAAAVGTTLATTEKLRIGDHISINNHPITITDIIEDAGKRPELLRSILISDKTAVTLGGNPIHMNLTGFTPPAGATTYAKLLPHAIAPGYENSIHPTTATLDHSTDAPITPELLTPTHYLTITAALLGALLIGIIQYAAVAEHLNEYALKKALGARGKHLFLELLLRSSAIGLAGGTLGLIIGIITLAITAVLIDQPAYITPWALPTALTATTILGGLGGTAAATRAARISPTTVIHP